jgi:hypothetical protein
LSYKIHKINQSNEKFARKMQKVAKTLQKITSYLMHKSTPDKQLDTF